MLYIGIDPGVKTGFAVWSSQRKEFTEISTYDFWGVVGQIRALQEALGVTGFKVIIEDPNQNKPVFEGKNFITNLAFARTNPQKLLQFIREVCKISQNVGSNKREASLLIGYLEAKGIPYEARRPNQNSFTKLTAKEPQNPIYNRAKYAPITHKRPKNGLYSRVEKQKGNCRLPRGQLNKLE